MTVNGKYIGAERYITRLLGDGGGQTLTPELQRLVDSMADDGEALIITGVDEEQLIKDLNTVAKTTGKEAVAYALDALTSTDTAPKKKRSKRS